MVGKETAVVDKRRAKMQSLTLTNDGEKTPWDGTEPPCCIILVFFFVFF